MNAKGEADYSHNDGLGVDDAFGPPQPSSTAVPDQAPDGSKPPAVAAEAAPGDTSAIAPAPEATEAAVVDVDANTTALRIYLQDLDTQYGIGELENPNEMSCL